MEKTPAQAPRGSYQFEVRVPTNYQYDVLYDINLMEEYGSLLVKKFGRRSVAVLTDSRVNKLYGDAFIKSFLDVGIEPDRIVVPEGRN